MRKFLESEEKSNYLTATDKFYHSTLDPESAHSYFQTLKEKTIKDFRDSV